MKKHRDTEIVQEIRGWGALSDSARILSPLTPDARAEWSERKARFVGGPPRGGLFCIGVLLIGSALSARAEAQEVFSKVAQNWHAAPYWQPAREPGAPEAIGAVSPESSSAQASSSAPVPFVAMPPCRVVDTRLANGPVMSPGETRSFAIGGVCGAPPAAAAYSLNVTVVPSGPLGYLTIWPAGQPQPLVSTLNSPLGVVVANAAVVPSGANGSVSVFVTQATHVVIDINGYYGGVAGQVTGANANLAFNLNPGTPSSPNFPHPFESDQGWGGGAQPQQLVDGFRGCNDPTGWACGLAFTGGSANWGGQACGVRQATIDLGSAPAQVSAVRITHHGTEHIPAIYQIQTLNGSAWVTQVSITNNTGGRCISAPSYDPAAAGWTCTITDEFPPVQTTKVRYTFNNCPGANTNITGAPITHGWLYEFEAYRLPW